MTGIEIATLKARSDMVLQSSTSFLCSVLVAPVKNENEEIIMCILNFEDISENKYASTPEETATPPAAENSVGYKWRRGRRLSLPVVMMDKLKIAMSLQRSMNPQSQNQDNHRTFRLKLPQIYRQRDNPNQSAPPEADGERSEKGSQEGAVNGLSQGAGSTSTTTELESSMPLLSLKEVPSNNDLPTSSTQSTKSVHSDSFSGGGGELCCKQSTDSLPHREGSLRDANEHETSLTVHNTFPRHTPLVKTWSNQTARSGVSIRRASSLETTDSITARKMRNSYLSDLGNFAKNLPSAASDSDLARYRQLRKDVSTHSLRSLDEHPLDSGLKEDNRDDSSSSSAVTKKILKPVRDATQVVGNRVTQVS
ncbi:uncharacterized protein LOC129274297 [Lytechinus pictus]|uniref:uncharacterized protein LOC129274297 n=1 Tax=Lytechinus pictus TaxID=7653 RepID=UPI0030BA052E